ncbi:MAG: hypothetical protein GY750_14235 [Lentisphaerae bacterium]|nr:hypothetical protein [Lentisphaerota bacterium]MCP4102559.1 hypothetical protein [Lentisphaerota bacterium]
MLFNNKFTDNNNVGGHAWSVDGVHWTMTEPSYSRTVRYTDGSSETMHRRERPQILWLDEKKQKGILFNGVQPSSDNDKIYTLATPIGMTVEEAQNYTATK